MRKKVCVVTGCRSEYGLLLPLLIKIRAGRHFQLQIIATGTHLSSEFGSTYKLIERDGFKINRKVRLPLSDDSEAGITKSVGYGMIGFSNAFARLKPDLVIFLGDRFEIFSAAATAFLSKIPIAHIHGGELTEGSIDDGLRHAITKFSTFHLCSTGSYKKRIIQLGENPASVFDVGALGIDNIRNLKLLDKSQVENELNFRFGKRSVLITFYPSTAEVNSVAGQFKELLAALDIIEDLNVIFTKPAADINARVISKLIDEYVSRRPGRAAAFINLGQLMYLSVMKHVNAVVGNSSSGIIEAPSLGKPTVNIGFRQKGRVAAKSVIDCAPLSGSIVKALKKAFAPGFNNLCSNVKNPYGNGRAAEKIYKILREKFKGQVKTNKTFYDLRVK